MEQHEFSISGEKAILAVRPKIQHIHPCVTGSSGRTSSGYGNILRRNKALRTFRVDRSFDHAARVSEPVLLPEIKQGPGLLRGAEARDMKEQMTAFLERGDLPTFTFEGNEEYLKKRLENPKHKVNTKLLPEAIFILQTVNTKYGSSDVDRCTRRNKEKNTMSIDVDEWCGDDERVHSLLHSSQQGSSQQTIERRKSVENVTPTLFCLVDNSSVTKGKQKNTGHCTFCDNLGKPGDQGYLDAFLGKPISKDEASNFLSQYLIDNKINGRIAVKWTRSVLL